MSILLCISEGLRAEQQIALRLLIGDVKRAIAELAAAEGRLLSIRSVAEEIIRTGNIPLPLKVRFAGVYEDIPKSRLEYEGDYGLN